MSPVGPPSISAPQAGSCYFPLRAEWDLSVDWALSKGRHAPDPDDVLVFLYFHVFFLLGGLRETLMLDRPLSYREVFFYC